MKKKLERFFLEITVELVVILDVMVLHVQLLKKEAPINQCPVGGNEVAKKIGEILHLEVEENTHLVAYVKCKGTCDKIQRQYQYDGIHDCLSAAVVPGSGDKKCRFGCMGYGSCVKACAFDAIHVIDGVAQVDKEKCKSCQKCMDACPQASY